MGTDRTWKRNKARQKRNGAELDLVMRVLSAPLRNGFFFACCVCVCEVDGWWVGVCGVFHLLKFTSLSKTPLSLCPFVLSLHLSFVNCSCATLCFIFYSIFAWVISQTSFLFPFFILFVPCFSSLEATCSACMVLQTYPALSLFVAVLLYSSTTALTDSVLFIPHWLFKSTTVEVEHFDPLMVASSGRIYCIQEHHLTWYATGIFIFLVFTSSSSSLCIISPYLLQKKTQQWSKRTHDSLLLAWRHYILS